MTLEFDVVFVTSLESWERAYCSEGSVSGAYDAGKKKGWVKFENAATAKEAWNNL